MKKIIFYLFVMFIILSFVSCDNGVKTSKVTYVVYSIDDETGSGGYFNQTEKFVVQGTKFIDVAKPSYIDDVIMDDVGYRFSLYWTEDEPEDDDPILSAKKVYEDTLITKDITLYAIYEKVTTLHTVKFMIWDTNERVYKQSGKDIKILDETMFKNIKKPNVDDIIIGGTKFTLSGWIDVSSSEIIEDFQQQKIGDDILVTQDKVYYAIYKGDYLCFTAQDDTEIMFYIDGTKNLLNPISLQYRKEGDPAFTDYTWGRDEKIQIDTQEDGKKISLVIGEKIYFKGNNQTLSRLSDGQGRVVFKSTGNVEASGSVMSLLNVRDTIPNEGCFFGFFDKCNTLQTAPELPATTLAENSYYFMFKDCTSLQTAPELPATTLADDCYNSMFRNCTSLTTAPDLLATQLASYSYGRMFYQCSSLKKAPKILATTLEYHSCDAMFQDCTSLETAPELLATTLAKACYCDMFKGCSSLKIAPKLLAPTLVEDCYQTMFANCSSLQSITCYATNTSATNCTKEWVIGVSSAGEFKCPTSTSWLKGSNGIPTGWKRIGILHN